MHWQAGFKNCALCHHSFSVSNKHTHCLYCLGEAHIVSHCSICCSFPSRTQAACELPLQKYLMEEVMQLCVQPDLAPPDVPQQRLPLAVSALLGPSCVVPVAPLHPPKPHHVHKKHGHKGGSPTGTTSKCSVTSLSHVRLGKKLRLAVNTPAPKKAHTVH